MLKSASCVAMMSTLPIDDTRALCRNPEAQFSRRETSFADRHPSASATHCRDNGRQRTLGKEARKAADLRTPRRLRFGEGDHRHMRAARDQGRHALRILDRELETSEV